MSEDFAFLPYQIRWAMDQHPVIVAEKSRRIGFTWGTAGSAALNAMDASGHDTWYLGYNKPMSADFIEDVVYWADMFQAGLEQVDMGNVIYPYGKREECVFTYEARFASGNKVKALSSRPTELRGKGGDVIIDEAAHHKDLMSVLKSAMALTIQGARVMLISTHNGDLNPFNQYIEDVRAGKFDARIHTATFRQAIEEGFYRRMDQANGWPPSEEAQEEWVNGIYRRYGDDADEELDVIPNRGGAGYLSVQSIERAMPEERPVIRLSLDDDFALKDDQARETFILRWFATELAPLFWALPENLRHFMGQDFGRSHDKSALVPLTEAAGLTYDCPFVVELHNVPHTEQWLILKKSLEHLPNFAKCNMDARGNGEWLAEQAAKTFWDKVEPVKATDSYYNLNMPRMKQFFEDAIITVPRHVDVLRDLRSIETVKGVPKVPQGKTLPGTDGIERHGDVAMALFHAICATSSAGPAPASVSNEVPIRHYITGRRRTFFEKMGF